MLQLGPLWEPWNIKMLILGYNFCLCFWYEWMAACGIYSDHRLTGTIHNNYIPICGWPFVVRHLDTCTWRDKQMRYRVYHIVGELGRKREGERGRYVTVMTHCRGKCVIPEVVLGDWCSAQWPFQWPQSDPRTVPTSALIATTQRPAQTTNTRRHVCIGINKCQENVALMFATGAICFQFDWRLLVYRAKCQCLSTCN